MKIMDNNPPTMLTIKETAVKTGLAENFLRNLCKDRKIVYVKSGKKYLINLEKLKEFLNSGDEESSDLLPEGGK